MKSPALAIKNCVLAGRSRRRIWNLLPRVPICHVEVCSTCTDLPRGGMVQGSTCTDVTRGGTQGTTCANNFGISVQKIEEGDIHTIDGLDSSVMSSILSIDARTIILPPPCWRRKVAKPIRVLTYLFRISKRNHARMLCNIL